MFHNKTDDTEESIQNNEISRSEINSGDDPSEKPEEKPEEKSREKSEDKPDLKREIFEYVRMIAVVFIIVVLLQTFVVVNARIPSESMEPTINVGEQIFGNRLAYLFDEPERYDIVIFRYPDDKSRLFIKRIIGLPGDTIDIRDGDVYVNGSEIPLEDSFCMTEDSTVEGNLTYPLTVPEGCYFMLGDNRVYSKDSRFWENPFVERDDILGKAFFRYWPLNKISLISGNEDSYYQPPSSEDEE